MLAISFLLLAVACSSSDESGEQQPTTLTVYVYSPEHPMLIRGDVGNVNASFDESKITRLQIWVFENGTDNKVTYLDTDDTAQLNVGKGAVYQLPVSDEFARNKSKPKVDVYVLANVTTDNCGCSLDENSSREAILNAAISQEKFGLATPTTVVTVVPDDGLPMTGVLTAQTVTGEAPVLRVGTSSIATVPVTRAVSKVRFVFANMKGAQDMKIKKITLDAGVHPTSEYLIPRVATLSYNKEEVTLWLGNETVAKTDDPEVYVYNNQTAQVYETLIDQSGLTLRGPFYLRESDRRLTGVITYTIGDGTGGEVEHTRPFQMANAGDFLRNHTWIVYAYHQGGGDLLLDAVYVKDWNFLNEDVDHEIYNW